MHTQTQHKLIYHALSGDCRSIWAIFAEKKVHLDLVQIEPWNPPAELIALNPAGEIPVLIGRAKPMEGMEGDSGGGDRTESHSETDGEPEGEISAIVGFMPILEYLEEIYPSPRLLPPNPLERAEMRRLCAWFSDKFTREVTEYLTGEKLIKRLSRAGTPQSDRLRAGKANLGQHMRYVNALCESRKWLGGEAMSFADLTAAAHLSVLDYSGDVPWDSFPEAKLWYARIKSRPCFRGILGERLAGIPPVEHYDNLDF